MNRVRSDEGLAYSAGSSFQGGTYYALPFNAFFQTKSRTVAYARYYSYYGESLKVEFPSGSNNYISPFEVARQLSQKISAISIRDELGKRPVHGEEERYRNDPHFRALILFYEYFDAETCKGLGASHQTGWTGLVALLLKLFATIEPAQLLKEGREAAFESIQDSR